MTTHDDLTLATRAFRPCQKPDCNACALAREVMGRLYADARALWAFRVLDAWANAGDERFYQVRDHIVLFDHVDGRFFISVDGPDAARHAAALAVFPSLSAAKRAELGECP